MWERTTERVKAVKRPQPDILVTRLRGTRETVTIPSLIDHATGKKRSLLINQTTRKKRSLLINHTTRKKRSQLIDHTTGENRSQPSTDPSHQSNDRSQTSKGRFWYILNRIHCSRGSTFHSQIHCSVKPLL